MKCKYCQKNNTLKKGKRNCIQRYYCKECKRYFQESYTYIAYDSTIDPLLISLLKECCSVLGIARVLKISKNTVLSRILKVSKQIKMPYFNNLGCKYEIDEMWTFIGNKKNVTWITYAIEQKTGQVIDFFVGRKTKDNIRPLINKVLLLKPTRIYTDKLNIYPSLIPKEIHKRFQYCTNKIERMNLTLRTHIKRLSRRTICFSRKQEYLEAHLRIYFWG